MIYSIYFCDWFDRPQTSRLKPINCLLVLWCQIRNFLLDNPDFSSSFPRLKFDTKVSKTWDSTKSMIKKSYLVWTVSEQRVLLWVNNPGWLTLSSSLWVKMWVGGSEQNLGQMSTLSQGYRAPANLPKTKWTFSVWLRQESWQETYAMFWGGCQEFCMWMEDGV